MLRCMIPPISWVLTKIEGRMKSILYVASVVNAYRMALDGEPIDVVMSELTRISHRPYTTGFTFRESQKCRGGTYGIGKKMGEDNILYGGKPLELMEYETGGYTSNSLICGVVLEYNNTNKTALIEQRNRFYDGDTLSILAPSDVMRAFTVKGICNEQCEYMKDAPPKGEADNWL